jgi:hypothetical protein
MIGGVGSVRGLTVMIATEGIFVWCAVTPTSACKHFQQCAFSIHLPLQGANTSTRRFKDVESFKKTISRFPRDKKKPQN